MPGVGEERREIFATDRVRHFSPWLCRLSLSERNFSTSQRIIPSFRSGAVYLRFFYGCRISYCSPSRVVNTSFRSSPSLSPSFSRLANFCLRIPPYLVVAPEIYANATNRSTTTAISPTFPPRGKMSDSTPFFDRKREGGGALAEARYRGKANIGSAVLARGPKTCDSFFFRASSDGAAERGGLCRVD